MTAEEMAPYLDLPPVRNRVQGLGFRVWLPSASLIQGLWMPPEALVVASTPDWRVPRQM